MRVWEALQSEWQVRQLSVNGFEGLNVREKEELPRWITARVHHENISSLSVAIRKHVRERYMKIVLTIENKQSERNCGN